MKNYIRTILCATCFVFAGVTLQYAQKTIDITCPGANGLTNEEIADILAVHNDERAQLKLPLLKWDCRMADLAQDWVNRSVVEHRETLYGESIFVASNPKAKAMEAFAKWMREKENWDEMAGRCLAGKTCTHYGQIIAKDTQRIGCGINRNNPGKWPLFLICNYDPAGNMMGMVP